MSKSRLHSISITVFILFWTLCPFTTLYADNTHPALQHQTLVKELQLRLDRLQKEEGLPGVTLGVILPDGTPISLASGMADIEEKIPMKPGDRILMGSIGKTYVASVALQMMAEKKFSLDDKLSKFFGHEPWFSRIPNANDLTVKLIMTHTAGLPRYVFKPGVFKTLREQPDKVWKPLELLAYVFDDKPVHAAGKGWAYSDTDFILLGMIIEKMSGNTYYNELQKRILTPLGLTHTEPSVKRQLQRQVQGYTSDNQPPVFLPRKMLKNGVYAINPQFEWCGGGLITNALELATFVKKLLEGDVVSKESLALMKQAVDCKTGQPGTHGYGLGLEVYQTDEGLTYGHRGTMPGYGSIMEYVPRYKFSIALQINADGFSGKLNPKKSRNDYVNALKPVIIKYIH